MTIILIFLVAIIMNTVIHEIGHAALVVKYGAKVVEIQIGVGRTIFQFSLPKYFDNAAITINRNLFGGRTIWFDASTEDITKQRLHVGSGGIIANLLLAGILWIASACLEQELSWQLLVGIICICPQIFRKHAWATTLVIMLLITLTPLLWLTINQFQQLTHSLLQIFFEQLFLDIKTVMTINSAEYISASLRIMALTSVLIGISQSLLIDRSDGHNSFLLLEEKFAFKKYMTRSVYFIHYLALIVWLVLLLSAQLKVVDKRASHIDALFICLLILFISKW